jgi:lipopolysaccharide transport system permease protein
MPIALLLFQGFGFGLGLFFGTLNVFLRDIGHGLLIAMQLWMWTTPVVYVETILPPPMRTAIAYNPAYPFIDALHSMMVNGQWPTLFRWTQMIFWALVTPVVGYMVLRALRPEIRDAL